MNVPKLRFKEFDGEWEEETLQNVSLKIGDGLHATPQYEDFGEYYFINGNNLINGKIIFNEKTKRISKEEFQKYKFSLSENTILLSINGTIGNLAFYDGEKVLLGKSVGYIALDKEKVNEYFIYYLLQTSNLKRYFKNELTGTTIKNLSLGAINKGTIYLPHIQEQNMVGDLFKYLDKKIQLQQQKIDLLQEQKKGYMQKIFNQKMLINEKANWTLMSIKDLAKVKTGKAFSSKDFVEDGKYLVVTNKNIQDQEKGIISTGDRINIEDGKILKDYILNGENILVTMDGVNIGKVGKYSHPKALIAQRVGRLISEEIDFVYQITKDERFITEMNKLSVGNAIKHISLQQIANYQFMAPVEKEERRKIGHFLSNLDKKIMLLNNQLVFLKKQKRGFMQKMFI